MIVFVVFKIVYSIFENLLSVYLDVLVMRLSVMEMFRMSLSDSTANPEQRLFRDGLITLFNIVIIPVGHGMEIACQYDVREIEKNDDGKLISSSTSTSTSLPLSTFSATIHQFSSPYLAQPIPYADLFLVPYCVQTKLKL